MTAPPDALIVEDDPLARGLIAATLADNGYRVLPVATLAEARRILATPASPALIVLDLGLPDGEGLALLREIKDAARARPEPPPAVLVITARIEAGDAVASLDIGADDHVRKPFDPAELIARVRAVMRRRAAATARAEVAAAGWRFDPDGRRLLAPDGAAVALTRAEFDLLHTLAAADGRALSRASLLDAIGSAADATDRTVDVLIGRIRRKLDAAAAAPPRLETVQGMGYRLLKPA